MTKLNESEILGDEAYKKGDFSKAIEKYESLLEFAHSRLHAAELAHKIALSYRGMRIYDKYLQYEEIASDFYPSLCSDQAADFLKEAGDLLYLIGENELSRRAYERASLFFTEASYIEDDIYSAHSMNAWSAVCKAKLWNIDSSEIWIEASKLFFEAAKESEDILAKWRNSKAYQCLAMSKISNVSSVENLKEVYEMLKKAEDLDKNDKRLGISLNAIQIILALADIKEGTERDLDKKSIILNQFFEMSNRIRSIGPWGENLASNLDFLVNKTEDRDLIDLEYIDAIWNALIRIIHIFAL